MLNQHMGRVDEFSENFNKEIKNIKMEMEIIKGNQSVMKNTLSEMRSILNGINKVDKEKDQIPYLKDEKAKDTQSEWQEMRCQDYKNNLRSIWDTIKGPNIVRSA